MEASLVFPFLLLGTAALLFSGVYTYRQAEVVQTASLAAQRTAYVWDNSFKDGATGSFHPNQYDGLYWRWTQDQVLDVFRHLFAESSYGLPIPLNGKRIDGLAEKKLARSAALLPAGLTGSISYNHFMFMRRVEVQLREPFALPGLLSAVIGKRSPEGQAVSWVVEPVELIRLTDFTRRYVPLIKDRISPQRMQDALVEPQNDRLAGSSIAIASERQAAAYLRKLVGGTELVVRTMSGKSRTIDALDSNGIAHIAFYTFTEAQLLGEQLPKDLELLQAGRVAKGVVWHFFKKDAKGGAPVSDKLRRALESKGVAVVVHQ